MASFEAIDQGSVAFTRLSNVAQAESFGVVRDLMLLKGRPWAKILSSLCCKPGPWSRSTLVPTSRFT